MESTSTFARLLVLACCLMAAACSPVHRDADDVLRSRKNARIFETPDEALAAMIQVFKSEDPAQFSDVFGNVGARAFLTGDAMADRVMMRRVYVRLERRAELFPVRSADYSREQWYKIRFDKQGWNMRVPLVNRGQGWLFAPEYAADELREFRREFNEIVAASTSRILVRAEEKYFEQDRDGDGVKEYTQRILSSPGKQDGLYWPPENNAGPSPLDTVVAKAVHNGYEAQDGAAAPVYEGYVYRILEAQGSFAPGGAKKFVVDGNMTGGFAILAYPVRWGQTGAKTFLTNSQGLVVSRDLGFKTKEICDQMMVMDSDRWWSVVEHPDG